MSLDELKHRVPTKLHPFIDQGLSERRLRLCLDLLDRRLNGLVVAAEAIHKRHNVSAILRSAEGFGLHEAHLITGAFRPSPGAARGAERWLDLHIHPTATDCLTTLKAQGYQVYVADFTPDAVPPEEVPVERPTAVLFGSELVGVSDEARAMADGTVMIPMAGVTQSLNVSAAAAVCLYTLTKRRRQVPGAVGLTEASRARFLEKWLRKEWGRIKSGVLVIE